MQVLMFRLVGLLSDEPTTLLIMSFLSLGRSETLEFATGQIRQPTALLGEETDAFSHF